MLKLPVIALVALNALFTSSSQDQWSATLSPSNGSTISGTATADGVGTADSTLVRISIQGAPANATLPWHIHNGSCGSTKDILGGESKYPKLITSSAGTAQTSVTLPMRPAKTGAYAVQVHQGTAAPGKSGSDVISCGNLRPVMNKMPSN